MEELEWCLELCTLGGTVASVAAKPGSTVGELRVLARQCLELDPLALPLLCHGSTALRQDSQSLQAAGLANGMQVSVVVHRALHFTEVLCPPGTDREGSVALKPQASSNGGQVLANFHLHTGGYRCALAEPLPGTGRQAVAFDFLRFSPFMAVGLHAEPRLMRRGPLGSSGWIGETPGGACLYQGTQLRHAGAELPARGGLPVIDPVLGRFAEGSSVALIVDHEDRTLTWLVFLGPGLDPITFLAELPAPLAGRQLWPAVTATNRTQAIVRVRREDPAHPRWCSGAEPLE